MNRIGGRNSFQMISANFRDTAEANELST